MSREFDESRVLVTGGRDYQDRVRVFDTLDRYHDGNPVMIVIHGACCKQGHPTQLTGADRWAQEWAQEREVPYIGAPARWYAQGTSAGPLRNKFMLERFQPTSVIAFPGGKGTSNMVTQARAAGLVIWEPFGSDALTSRLSRARRPIR